MALGGTLNSHDVRAGDERKVGFGRDTPRKINGWNIIPWRFGSDHVPLEKG